MTTILRPRIDGSSSRPEREPAEARAGMPGAGAVSGQALQVRLLGPVDVTVRGVAQPFPGLRRKSVLAILALHPGKVVNASRLIDLVWGDEPPATAANTLQRHISYLRMALRTRAAIVARPPGYLLDVPADAIDVTRVTHLVGSGGPTVDHARTVVALRQALELWRGPSLVDVTDVAWLNDQARRLDELRLDVVERLAEARLALGEHVSLVPELEDLAARYPYREDLYELLMLALYRCGRQADALAAFQRVRRTLEAELGIDAGPGLRGLEVAILRQDPQLDLSSPSAPLLQVSASARSEPQASPAARRSELAASARSEPQASSAARRPEPPAPTGQPDTVLLERESSLSSLREYAARAEEGEGRLVLIAGEAGVGKSTLVERLRTEFPDANWWWGACDGLFTPRPLGPLFDLADQVGGDLAALCRDGAERGDLFRALLRQICTPGTLDVVVIEDVHWADDATLDLLRYLGRRLRDAGVLLIVTYRDDALAPDDPLRVALGDLASQRCTRQIRLTPLSPQAVEVLAAGSGLGTAELYRLTGGNPFYLTAVLRGGAGEVPASARDAVLAQASRLGAGAREVLDVAALTGNRVEARLLESVTGCPPSAIDELVTSGLLSGDDGGLRFRHEIARLAVAQAVSAHRGPVIHRLVLAALQSLGCEDDARLAFHAQAADEGAFVLRYAPAAARQASRLSSHREAAAQFELSLRYADGVDPATLAGLYQDYAAEVSLLDRWQEAETAGERALALWREAGDRLREGDVLRRLSRIRWRVCHGREAAAASQAALSALEPLGPSVELAWAYATFANQRMLFADHDAAIGLAARARELAERFDATDVVSDALNTRAASAAAKGLEWSGQLCRALDIALAGGHHDEAARAYTNLCAIHIEKREFALAEPYLAEGIAYCDEHDITTYARCLRAEQLALLECTGRWDEAVALSAELLVKAGPSPINRLYALIRVGTLAAHRGVPDVWEYLDEAVVIAAQTREPQQQVPLRLARAEAHWLAGRRSDARREAELADDACPNLDAWHRGAVAVWLRRTGSTRPARGDVPEPFRLQLDGRPIEAAAVWTRLGCPYESALAITDSAASAALREALRIATELGAAPAARIVGQRVRALEVR